MLNGARDNVIVYPCSYTASHADLAWLIGPDCVLDPARWLACSAAATYRA